jgi:hypothetical protein
MVHSILDTKRSKTLGTLYKIRWQGYSEEYDTWEPERNLSSDIKESQKSKRKWTQVFQLPTTPVESTAYPDAMKSVSPIKLSINELFASAVKSRDFSLQHQVLYLDAKSFTTTKTLSKSKIKALCVPVNNQIGIFNSWLTHALMNSEHNHILPKFGNIGDVIVGSKERSICAVWLDYCCTFSGNRNVRPKKDICNLLTMDKLRKQSIFAMTVSLRSRDNTMGNSHSTIGQNIIEYISTIFAQHQYNITLVCCRRYHRNMLFLMFNCT